MKNWPKESEAWLKQFLTEKLRVCLTDVSWDHNGLLLRRKLMWGTWAVMLPPGGECGSGVFTSCPLNNRVLSVGDWQGMFLVSLCWSNFGHYVKTICVAAWVESITMTLGLYEKLVFLYHRCIIATLIITLLFLPIMLIQINSTCYNGPFVLQCIAFRYC